MAQPFMDIKMVRGETAVVGTNDRSKITLLNNLGFTAAEEEDGVSYFEIDSEFIQIRRPRDTSGRAEMTDEQKGVTKARLVLARANKDAKWAENNKELVQKWAESHPEMLAKYGANIDGAILGNGKKASTKAKAKTKTRVPDPAPEPEPEEVEEEEEDEQPEPTPAPSAKKSGLAGRLKVRR